MAHHGTGSYGFSEFMTFGRNGSSGAGAFFSSSRDSAESFSDGEGGGVYDVFLNIRKPKFASFDYNIWSDASYAASQDDELEEYGVQNTDDVSRFARERGYDGTIISDVMDDLSGNDGAADVFTVFSPEQIKSATQNTGAFDPDSPNILYQSANGSLSSDMSDARYFSAIEAGDMETAQRIVDYRAARQGYISTTDYRMSHQAPNSHDEDVSTSLAQAKKSGIVPDDYWTTPRYYLYERYDYESFGKVISAINRSESGKHDFIRMFRAVPKNVKDSEFRNGDWITPSREYAKLEGSEIPGGYRIIESVVSAKDVWWDGNSINEFGFDDGKSYAYKNTSNNRKLNDAVVHDRDGNIVPPSKRFNYRKIEHYYQFAGQRSAMSEPVRAGLSEAQRLAGRGAAGGGVVAALRGDEIGAELNGGNVVSLASAWFKKHLQGHSIERDGFGSVRVSGKGWGKLKRGLTTDLKKARLIPAIPEIIRSGAYQGRFPIDKPRSDDIVALHHFEADVRLGDEMVRAGVSVGEDSRGNLFYNLNHDPQDLLERRGQNERPRIYPGKARGRSLRKTPTTSKA